MSRTEQWLRLLSASSRQANEEQQMSDVRVHNFAISLDGFATGAGQAPDAPFGHAGQRLHEWMFATRFWSEMGGGRWVSTKTGVWNGGLAPHTPL